MVLVSSSQSTNCTQFLWHVGQIAGGDQNGSNLRSATYSANNLNQYTSAMSPPPQTSWASP
jgi:hypothetical protein